jgi:hypothetical protein
MSSEDERRYKGVSEGGGPMSAIAVKLEWTGCAAAPWLVIPRTNITSECGGSYFGIPRNGTVFRSARTVSLQQEVCTYVIAGPSVAGCEHVQVHRSFAIMGHTYNAIGRPTLKMVKRAASVEAVSMLNRLRFIEKSSTFTHKVCIMRRIFKPQVPRSRDHEVFGHRFPYPLNRL